MSKRRLNNLLKRRLSSLGDLLFSKNAKAAQKVKGNEFIKSQLKDISRLGGNVVAMRMGN